MNPSYLSSKGLSYNGLEFSSIADDIQGNILKGHGRSHVTHLFFTFKSEKVLEAKKWLHTFGKTQLTTAAKQQEQTLKFQKTKEQTFFFGLYLTASCYEYLEMNTKQPNDPQFRKAMTDASVMADLEDPSLSEWEEHWQKPVHGCVLIAYNGDRAELDLMSLFIEEDIEPFADTFKEIGGSLKNAYGDDIEHFGYVDGISQPKFFQEEINEIPTDKWNPLASWDLVLTDDRFGSYGSYWVFRKLEQDVQKFKKDEMKAATQKGLWGEDAEIVGAELVGRWENGMPRKLAQNDETIGDYTIEPSTIGKINNFNYNDDPNIEGVIRCPYHAHIRRVNPRDESLARIVRRGIPYGERTVDSFENPIKHGPTEGVGLLFQCFQSDIGLQFEAIQKAANKLDKEGKNDPVIGCPAQNKYVKLKGGGYFFAPSRLFFEALNPNYSQLNRSIMEITKEDEKALKGYYTHSGIDGELPVYYASNISDAVIKDLFEKIRHEIKVKVQDKVTPTTTFSFTDIIDLFKNDKECRKYLTEIAALSNWQNTENEKHVFRKNFKNILTEGGGLTFKNKEGEDETGAVIYQCGNGVCCKGEESDEYLIVPKGEDLYLWNEMTKQYVLLTANDETSDGWSDIYDIKQGLSKFKWDRNNGSSPLIFTAPIKS